jgi:Tol biopolymer transport system component/DNA-binding winged helix-turn-helix (wHTH) protein
MAQQEKHFYEFGPFQLDPGERVLRYSGKPVPLTPKALETLLVLVQNHGHIVEKDQLMKEIWPDAFVEEGNLNVHISLLRKTLGALPDGSTYIETIAKRGYRFAAPVELIEDDGAEILVRRRTRSHIVTQEIEEPSPESGPAEGQLVGSGQKALPGIAPQGRFRFAGILLAATGLVVVGLLLARGFIGNQPTPPIHFIPITSFPGTTVWPGAISPDGNYVAYATNRGTDPQTHLYVQVIGGGDPLRLNEEGALGLPAWSPDAHFIAFIRETPPGKRAIYTVPLFGGADRKLAELMGAWPSSIEVNWSGDGKWIAYADRETAAEPLSVYVVSPETGEKKRITSPPADSEGDTSACFSPDGKSLAFVRRASQNPAGEVYVVSREGGVLRQVTAGSWSKLTPAWTPDGREIIYSSKQGVNYEMWRIPAAGGSPRVIPLTDAQVYFPSIALRGNRMAILKADDDFNIWRLPLTAPGHAGDPSERLIYSKRRENSPRYSPDGKKILFMSNRTGSDELWVANSDGGNPQRLTWLNGPLVDQFDWLPDGQRAVIEARSDRREAYLVKLDGSPPQRFDAGGRNDSKFHWSRDGRRMYFSSDRSGQEQLWRMPAAGGPAVQLTKDGGMDGAESADGKYVYFSKDFTHPGLWRIPAEGGPATLVLEGITPFNWVLTDAGIYFVNTPTGAFPSIEYLDLVSGKVRTVMKVNKTLGATLDVSRDGRWLLFVQNDRGESDIMVVENFR